MSQAAEVDLKLLRAASLLDTDPAAAARAAAEILRACPGHHAATLLLGNAQRRTGAAAAATSAFSALAAAQPDSAVVQLELARALHGQGLADQALASYQRALELQPDLAEAWRELSALQAERGSDAACDAAFARYSALVAEDAHLHEAAAALAQHRLSAAEALLQNALTRQPHDWAALRMLAHVARAREEYREAEQLLRRSLQLAPGYSRARLDLAALLNEQQKAEPMLPLLARLLVLEPASLPYRTLLAAARTHLGEIDEAARILGALLREHPENEHVWLYYGHTMRAAGRVHEAIDAYRRSTELNRQFGEAWYCLANLKTFRFAEAEVAAMRAQLALADLEDSSRMHLEFALGKAQEDAAQYADAFAHYERGNALRRAAARYDPESSSRLVRRSCGLYTQEFFAARAGWGCTSEEPIFIVGLPRAGSTLLEQILASHSQVEGTRELPDVTGFALELGMRDSDIATYPQSVADLTRAEVDALGERYLMQTRAQRLLGRPHFIDKAPLNFLNVGLMHLILPRARIIDARRAPLACCFANFKQHYETGVLFSYSLENLGRFYRDYVSLMAHFDTVLPGRIHRVQYENLVADLEGEVRRLLSYCGLPFEESCLNFFQTRRAVYTVSSEQVRQPIYSQGLDQWRHFEPWLGPLKQALGDLADSAANDTASGRR